MAPSRKHIWKKHPDVMALGLTLVISLLLLAADGTRPAQEVKSWFVSWAGAVQKPLTWGARLSTLRQDRRRLQDEVARYALLYQESREALFENQRLRKLLNLREREPVKWIPAEVIGRGGSGALGRVFLNVGMAEGCVKDMPLMTDAGVAGRLVAVGRGSSVGQLVADPNFRISAKVQRNRGLGIVRWLYGNVCRMDGLSPANDVAPGDMVVSSGYSQIYPEGLIIGTVFQVTDPDHGLFKEVLLKTAVNFETLDEVLVLKTDGDS